MNGQELYKWLAAISEEDRRAAECSLEGNGDTVPLVTAKIYTEFGTKKRIYLIHK